MACFSAELLSHNISELSVLTETCKKAIIHAIIDLH